MSPFKRFSILKRVHRKEQFESPDDHEEFLARLRPLVERGVVVAIPVNRKHHSSLDDEAWFKDTRTGIVYRYIAPDWPSVGRWAPVEHPEEASYFESLCGDLYPTREQHDRLVAELDRAWAAKEIECAQPAESGELEYVFFHHPGRDETYQLILANPYQKGGFWMKVFHSDKDGSWPGELVPGPPPWRRPRDGGGMP